jgi:hypothetical protein
MKYASLLLVFLLLVSSVVLSSCGGGGSSSNSSSSTNASLEISGSWTISSSSGNSQNSMTASLVSSPCQVNTPIGTFSVYTDSSLTTLASTCFIADDNSGQGSISGTSGTFLYPPQGVLLGVQSDPVAANSSEAIGAIFVEADAFGNYAI